MRGLYWYFGTLAMARAGQDAWHDWRDYARTAILDHQRAAPVSFKGSWDPVDPWGRYGGRVYSTALMTICAEALRAPDAQRPRAR